jgi:hypothetical protein
MCKYPVFQFQTQNSYGKVINNSSLNVCGVRLYILKNGLLKTLEKQPTLPISNDTS